MSGPAGPSFLPGMVIPGFGRRLFPRSRSSSGVVVPGPSSLNSCHSQASPPLLSPSRLDRILNLLLPAGDCMIFELEAAQSGFSLARSRGLGFDGCWSFCCKALSVMPSNVAVVEPADTARLSCDKIVST